MTRPELEPPKRLPPLPWWVAVCGLIAIGLSTWGVYAWLTAAADASQDSKEARLRVEIIRNALTFGAGVGGVAALSLVFRKQHSSERQLEFEQYKQAQLERTTRLDYEQRERDAVHRRITETRFQAVEQLGSDRAQVRISGLHNLERLGEQNADLRPLVLNEICAYLRLNDSPPASDEDASVRVERQVTLTAQRVVKRHLSGGPSDPHFWEHEALDLSDATLHDLDLRGCHLHNANFYNARFHGITRFNGAEFFGGPVNRDAVFHGEARYQDAVFHGVAEFGAVTFHAAVSFASAEFDEPPRFGEASAPMEPEHCWPQGWSLAADPRRPGMGRLRHQNR